MADSNLSLERNTPGLFMRGVKTIARFFRTFFNLIGTLFVIGFSLLPLSALLVALPAVSPNEAVLTDTVRPTRSRWRRIRRRRGSCWRRRRRSSRRRRCCRR